MVVNFMKPSPVLIKLQGLQNPVTSTVKNTMFCVLQRYKFVGFKFASYSAKKKKKSKTKTADFERV